MNEKNFIDWFFTGDNSKNLIAALNNVSFKRYKLQGPFVRLEKSPAHIYGVVINEDGQHKHPFWKELYRLGLKLVKIGFTQQETIKGTGNRMEIIQKQIKSELSIESSPIFCLMIDFTTTASFAEVEEDIRSKVGIKLDKEFAKWLKLPMPTEWVLTSQEMISSLTKRIEEKKKQCSSNKTIYTTKDMEPCDLQSIEKLVNEISLSYVGLKDNKIVMRTEEEVLVENFKKALKQFV